MAAFLCDVVSAENRVFSGPVSMVVATGADGELGIMPGHMPLLTSIKPGTLRLRDPDGEEQLFYLAGGFLEVQPHMVTILADTVERAEDLDEAEVQKAEEEARRAIQESTSDMDFARAAAELAEASARLKTLRQMRGKY